MFSLCLAREQRCPSIGRGEESRVLPEWGQAIDALHVHRTRCTDRRLQLPK